MTEKSMFQLPEVSMKLVFFVTAAWLIGGLCTFVGSLLLLLTQLLNLSLGRLFAFASLAMAGLAVGQFS